METQKQYSMVVGFNAWVDVRRDFSLSAETSIEEARPHVIAIANGIIQEVALASGNDTSETPDAFIVVDLVGANGQTLEENVDEFNHPDHLPIAYDCVALVQRLAAVSLDDLGTHFMTEGDIPRGTRKLIEFIREARKLCGTEPASKEENAQ